MDNQNQHWRYFADEWRNGDVTNLLQCIPALRSAYDAYMRFQEWSKATNLQPTRISVVPECLSHLKLEPAGMLSINTDLSALFQYGYQDDGKRLYLLVDGPEYEWLRDLPIHQVHVGERSIYVQTLGLKIPGQSKAGLPQLLIELRVDIRNMRLIRAFEPTAESLGLVEVDNTHKGIELLHFDDYNTMPLLYAPRVKHELAIV